MKDKISYGIIVFLAFIIGGLTMHYFSRQNTYVVQDDQGNQTVCKSCTETVIVENGSLSAAIEKIYDATVMVNTYKNDKISNTGSGFVYLQAVGVFQCGLGKCLHFGQTLRQGHKGERFVLHDGGIGFCWGGCRHLPQSIKNGHMNTSLFEN